jgi:hypothetical protein
MGFSSGRTSTNMIIDRASGEKLDAILTKKTDKLYVDAELDWTSTARSGVNLIGEVVSKTPPTDYSWVLDISPFGIQERVLKKKIDTGNSVTGWKMDLYKVDPKKTYLLEVWIKDVLGKGILYWGHEEMDVNKIDDDQGNGPYVFSGATSAGDIGKWVRYSGLILPHDSGVDNSQTPNTQSTYTNGTDFKFYNANVAYIQPKLYLSYLSGTAVGPAEMYAYGIALYEVGSSDATAQITTLNKKTNGEVAVEEYGAVGDGIADDTVALQTAINDASAKHKKLILGSGKTYLISNQLTITGQTAIIGSPSHRPVIRVKSQTFDPIEASGTFVKTTSLKANATVNTKWIDVVSASGISAGMLIELISSLPWYHDPRTDSSDCRKAELHRVDEVIGNRIYFADPLMDGYDLTNETVTINAYNSIRVHMEEIELVMDRGVEPNDNIRRTGISLNYTVDTMLKNVFVTNAANAGIQLYHSYRPTVDGGRTTSANNYFAGYGVQTYGTTHAVIKNRHARNCRRGFDVSGGTIPSHFTTVEGCSVFGNGLNSLLDRYGFNDDHTTGTAVFGMGTHGGADHTVFRNNYMGYLHVGINDRGRNTTIENNNFIGDIKDSCIDVIYGENVIVRNNRTYDGFSGLKLATTFDGGSNFNARKPERFITFHTDALQNGSSGGFMVIENNFAMVQDRFISLSGTSDVTTAPVQKNFIVKNNHAMFSPQISANACWFVKNDSYIPTIMFSGSTFTGNTYERMAGSGDVVYIDTGVDLRDATLVESPKTYSFFLNDDTASSIWIGAIKTNWIRVIVDSNSVYGSVRVSNGTISSIPIGTPSTSLEVNSVVLSGTTGTDGKISLSFVNGKLYVENRFGAAQRIMITVMNYM